MITSLTYLLMYRGWYMIYVEAITGYMFSMYIAHSVICIFANKIQEEFWSPAFQRMPSLKANERASGCPTSWQNNSVTKFTCEVFLHHKVILGKKWTSLENSITTKISAGEIQFIWIFAIISYSIVIPFI